MCRHIDDRKINICYFYTKGSFLTRYGFLVILGNVDIIMHGVQKGVEAVELSFKADQSLNSYFYCLAVKNFLPEVMNHIHLDSSFLLEILIVRISAKASSSPIFLTPLELEIDQVHSIGVLDELLLDFPTYL